MCTVCSSEMLPLLHVFFVHSCFGASLYDLEVIRDKPVLFLANMQNDSGTGNHAVSVLGQLSTTELPNGETASVFPGHLRGFVEVENKIDLSMTVHSSYLGVEAWMCPCVLNFTNCTRGGGTCPQSDPGTRENNYVHWMGKGKEEYSMRMYSNEQCCCRKNRISGYIFGGLPRGNGSYYQPTQRLESSWLHVVFWIQNVSDVLWTNIAVNGALVNRRTVSCAISPYATSSPFFVGTRSPSEPSPTSFQGALGKVALYRQPLSLSRIKAHYEAMGKSVPCTCPH